MARTLLSRAIDQPLYYKSEASYSNRFPRNLLIENSKAREIVQSVTGLPYKHNNLSSSPRTHFKKKSVMVLACNPTVAEMETGKVLEHTYTKTREMLKSLH